MYERYIKLIISEKSEYLQKNHPWAFLLLTQICRRARRTINCPNGYEIGECHIGDYWEAGIPSEKTYRVAKDVLVREKIIIICETCRKRKKGASGRATYGTKVKLINSDIYDINANEEGDLKGERRATEGRPKGEEQECIKNVKNDKNTYVDSGEIRIAIDFFFCPIEKKFKDITDLDKENWKIAYPLLEIEKEIVRAEQWILSNPTKSKKKNWRKFLTGWFSRGNDYAENKAAYSQKKTRAEINGSKITEYDNLW